MSSTDDAATGAPIPGDLVAEVASEHPVSEPALADALARIHGDLVDGADAIHQYYQSEEYQSEDTVPSIVAADGLVEVIFVSPEMWNRVPTDLADEERGAAKAAHARFARSLGAPEETLDTHDALVMPSADVGELVRAGLSRRQAEVQVLRNAGLTQDEIGDRLGVATNTVKVHCHRVDAKVDDAKRLVRLVGG